jgi:hypothetical protein
MIDYEMLAAEHAVTGATWDTFVRAALVDGWVAGYEATTDWRTEILDIKRGELTFLFDAGPTLLDRRRGDGDDRVVAVWGRSMTRVRRRDRARLADSCQTRCSGLACIAIEGTSLRTRLAEDQI